MPLFDPMEQSLCDKFYDCRNICKEPAFLCQRFVEGRTKTPNCFVSSGRILYPELRKEDPKPKTKSFLEKMFEGGD